MTEDRMRWRASPRAIVTVTTPVLWRAPDDLPSRDLLLSPGGEEMRPDLRKVMFIKEETGGYSTKYRVRDASGRGVQSPGISLDSSLPITWLRKRKIVLRL